jgi:hypothetical protein
MNKQSIQAPVRETAEDVVVLVLPHYSDSHHVDVCDSTGGVCLSLYCVSTVEEEDFSQYGGLIRDCYICSVHCSRRGSCVLHQKWRRISVRGNCVGVYLIVHGDQRSDRSFLRREDAHCTQIAFPDPPGVPTLHLQHVSAVSCLRIVGFGNTLSNFLHCG